jgi:hypothetical protein
MAPNSKARRISRKGIPPIGYAILHIGICQMPEE